MVLRLVLIAGGDAACVQALARQFEADAGFTATWVTAAREAERCLAARDRCFDAVILDANLPDDDGRDLCARLRQQGYMAPILMLSGSDSEDDIVRGLEAGANDYVTKPCCPAVLLARLRAQLRGFDASVNATLSVGPYTFHPAAKLLHDPVRNRRIRLREREACLLKALHRAGGRVVDRETLLLEVWGYNVAVATHTVPCHIYRLRRKIEADPSNPRLLLTAAGGYRFDVDAMGPPP